MALAVCLLFDARTERALRSLWERLEAVGVPTLLTHTHRRHVPHLSYAVLREFDIERVREAVDSLPGGEPAPLHIDAVGLFRRGRAALLPAATSELVARQAAVADACVAAGADLHKHYLPGAWIPHTSLATHVRRELVGDVSAAAFGILPLEVVADRAALVDSSTGARWPLDRLP